MSRQAILSACHYPKGQRQMQFWSIGKRWCYYDRSSCGQNTSFRCVIHGVGGLCVMNWNWIWKHTLPLGHYFNSRDPSWSTKLTDARIATIGILGLQRCVSHVKQLLWPVFTCACKCWQTTQGRQQIFFGTVVANFQLVSSLNPQRFVRFTGYDIFTSRVPLEVDPILNPNTVCKNTPSLSKEQMELCKSHADVVASSLQGAQMAVHECQERFKYQRWNCSALETKNKNPLTSGLLARGTLILA